MKNLKVSIVTISYNQATFLEECINSVIQQNYPNIEYIVVDPGSTDGSRKIINKYSKNIKYIILDPDNGPSQGLNNGFKNATGDIFGFLNADDILLPNAVHDIADFFKQNINTDVVCGHGYQIDKNSKKIRKIFSTKWGKRYYAYRLSGIVQQSTFFKKEAYDKAGGFNENNKTCWDGELFLKMVLSGAKFRQFNKFISAFRLYENSSTGQGTNNPIWHKYLEDRKRLERMALGRDLNSFDIFIRGILRTYKLIENPRSTFYRLSLRK